MNRRKLLKSSVIAGTGVMLSGAMASTAEADTGGGYKSSQSGGCTILTKTRTLASGKAALTVPALYLGCMGMQSGRGVTPDEKSMEKLIQQAYDRGCNFFDTAEGYSAGKNEELLGRAIASIRKNVLISTKFTV
ncbi:MAG TPA: aldo/keto reductase, partial [Chryseolinea sp.]|nr:aldo/keto reductase [Chryseolinea sp.]